MNSAKVPFHVENKKFLTTKNHPEKYIEDFVKAGADRITIHTEAVDNVSEVVDMILSYGVKAGISIKPNTEIPQDINLLKKANYYPILYSIAIPVLLGISVSLNTPLIYCIEFFHEFNCDSEVLPKNF